MSAPFYCIEDARGMARRRLPRMIFDYVDGAAGAEVTNQINCDRIQSIKLLPRVLVNVDQRSLDKEFLGEQWSMPIGIAPMGMCNLTCPGADQMIAEAARAANIPATLSTMASSTIEDMKRWAGPSGWFQLYMGHSVEQAMSLVDRAEAAGYQTLMLTVDVPQVAPRVRELRNGFKSPLKIGPSQFIDFATHPRWSLETLFKGVPKLANFAEGEFDRHAKRGLADWEFLDRLRDHWRGNLVVKGVLSAEDAVRIKDAGVDAIYLSNHGGRQLGSAPAAIDQLPIVRQSVGANYPLLFDSGIRDGEGVIKALALGADFVMLGRAVLYSLAAAGREGLDQCIALMKTDIEVGMAQLGVNDINKISQNILHQT